MSYNDYVYTKPIEVRGGIRAGSKRGAFGSNWWARRWLQTLEEFQIGTRLDRGRSYARRGQVMSIDVQPGGVTARVQGSRKRPYSVSIEVRTISTPDWERLQEAMAEQPIIAASLLSGRMPDNIEECFRAVGLSMFPDRQDDLETDCSCPDWSNPCKHVAAVYLLLGEEFDRDPFLIFRMRGMDREDLLGPEFRRSAQTLEGPALPTEPLPPEPGEFWSKPADGAAGKGPFRPGHHTRTGCRPAATAGPVPTLAGATGDSSRPCRTSTAPPRNGQPGSTWGRRNRLTTQRRSARRNRHGPPPRVRTSKPPLPGCWRTDRNDTAAPDLPRNGTRTSGRTLSEFGGSISCLWSGLTGRLRSTSGVTGRESSVTLPTCRSGTGCTTWSGRQEVPIPASSASGRRTGGRQPGMNKRKLNLVRPTAEEEAEIAAQLAEDPDTYEWTEEDWANVQTTQELFPKACEWAARQKEALKEGLIQRVTVTLRAIASKTAFSSFGTEG